MIEPRGCPTPGACSCPSPGSERAKAISDCVQICRQIANAIGALPGSSIHSALFACIEKMEEIR